MPKARVITKHKYLILYTTGKVRMVTTNDVMSLEQLQFHVDGYIETNTLDQNLNLITVHNKEGKIKKLLPNPYFNNLLGNVILAKPVYGEIAGLDDDDITIVLATIGLVFNELVEIEPTNSYQA